MNRYTVKYINSEMATFVRREDAVRFARLLSREEETTCVVIDQSGKFAPTIFRPVQGNGND
jgi:hypothetical protein